MKTIEEIRKAFLQIHHKAIGTDDRAYMSIPADPNRDADLIVSAAIDELDQLRQAVVQAEAAYQWLEQGAAHPLVAEKMRSVPLVDHFKMAANNIATLEGELATAKQSVETLQAVASTCAEQAKADHDRAEKVETGVSALRARVRTLEGALTRMLNERGCSGCIRADRAPPYVRGKNTRLAADEHAGDCANLAALAALSGAQPSAKQALAEREASIVELRRALVSIDPCGGFNNHQWTDGKPCSVCGWSYETAGKVLDVVAALAQPAPQAALRAMLIRAVRLTVTACPLTNNREVHGNVEAIVDAVLKGES